MRSLPDALHGVRALLPLAVCGIVLILWTVKRRFTWQSAGPLELLALYGLVGMAASALVSPNPLLALYWSIAYLSVVLVIKMCCCGHQDAESLLTIIRMNWVLVAAAGIALFIGLALTPVMSGKRPFYNVVSAVHTMWGMPTARATGVARDLAVVGLVALARVLCSRSLGRRLAWGVGLSASIGALWSLYSAGANIGFVVAALVILHLSGKRWLGLAMVAVGLIGLVVFFDVVWAQVLRNKTAETLLSGRQNIWQSCWSLFSDSPLLGFGFHADRFLLQWPYRNHASNAVLHALVQAGALGGSAFLAAWVIGWRRAVGLVHGVGRQMEPYRGCTLEVVGVLTFLTVRSLFESSGAFFGVDWLLLAPLFAYLQIAGSTRQPEPARA